MAITLSIFNGFSKSFHCWKLERKVNLQQNSYNTSHHTFSMLTHYLAKLRSSNFAISGRKCKRKFNILWFLNAYPILLHLAYLLTCFISGSCLIFFINCRRFYYRVSPYWRAILIYQICLSVRPSVCPFVRLSVRYVPVLYENGLTYCDSFFHHTAAQSF